MNKTYVSIKSGGQISRYCLEDFRKDVVSFGRSSECDIQINDSRVSRVHGCFHLENGRWLVQDLESRNGLLINNMKVKRNDLANGMIVYLDGNSFADSAQILVNIDISPAAGGGLSGLNNTPSAKNMAYSPSSAKANKDTHTAAIVGGIIAAVVVIALGVVISVVNKGKRAINTLETIGDVIEDVTTEEPFDIEETEELTTEEATEEETTEAQGELSPEDIFENVRKSTVEIQAEQTNTLGSIGTGFFDDENGTVITNYHVIEGSYKAIIKTWDDQTYNVTGIVGYDKIKDLAILSTDMTDTIPLPKGTDEVKTGAKVFALGSSRGLSETFTEGMVTNASREQENQIYIQHDAPITNGNSGGPLLDSRGRVIGINTWIIVDGQNMNFAIPIDRVNEIDRNVGKTLSEVCENEYGFSFGESTWSDISPEGEQNVTISQGSHRISFDVPDGFTVTDIEGGKDCSYETDQNALDVSAIIVEDDSAVADNDILGDFGQEYIDEMCANLKSQFDIDAEGTSTRGTINNNDWYIFTVQGQTDEVEVEVNVMMCIMNGSYRAVQFTAIGHSGAAFNEIREKQVQIMSTVTVE